MMLFSPSSYSSLKLYGVTGNSSAGAILEVFDNTVTSLIDVTSYSSLKLYRVTGNSSADTILEVFDNTVMSLIPMKHFRRKHGGVQEIFWSKTNALHSNTVTKC